MSPGPQFSMNPVSTNAPVGDTVNNGTVVSVRGSIVEARFDEHLPAINTVLLAGPEGQIVIEVLAQSDERHVRGIALTSTQGLARGMPV